MKTSSWVVVLAVLGPMLALSASCASAQTLRVADRGDAANLDPHSFNETTQLSLLGNVYESLVHRGKDGKLVPSLALSWAPTSPIEWQFQLRQNVRFHSTNPFTADDVIFSIKRAQGRGSDVRNYVDEIESVVAKGSHTVLIRLKRPIVDFPSRLSVLYIMDSAWARTAGATEAVDRIAKNQSGAITSASGTGPYLVEKRDAGVRTVLARFRNHWSPTSTSWSSVHFIPIANDGTRLAALLSGDVDVLTAVAVSDVQRIRSTANLSLFVTPEVRTVFFGFNTSHDTLSGRQSTAPNPLRNVLVRQAIYHSIDADAIRRVVMQGLSVPTGSLVANFVSGYTAVGATRLAFDPNRARTLLNSAGYPNGFAIDLNCPNDRYVNDSRICVAIASYLAKVGIDARVVAEPRAIYFTRLAKREYSFFMLGYSPPSFDALELVKGLLATPDSSSGRGAFNYANLSDPVIDGLLFAAETEGDSQRRLEMTVRALNRERELIGYMPLHQQTVVWAARKGLTATPRSDGFFYFSEVTTEKLSAPR